jgi:hypothetical protein
MANLQSTDELIRVMEDWMTNSLPDDLLDTHNNGKQIIDYCLQTFGIVTSSALTRAYNALKISGVLDLKAAPKSKSKEELAAAENERMALDYLKSIAPQPDFQERVKAENAKKETDKAAAQQVEAKKLFDSAIGGYQCYRLSGNAIDFNMTSQMQQELRAVKVGDGRDWVKNLAAVKNVIQNLLDHPSVGDVTRTAKRLNAERVTVSTQRDSFGDDVKRAGILNSGW